MRRTREVRWDAPAEANMRINFSEQASCPEVSPLRSAFLPATAHVHRMCRNAPTKTEVTNSAALSILLVPLLADAGHRMPQC